MGQDMGGHFCAAGTLHAVDGEGKSAGEKGDDGRRR